MKNSPRYNIVLIALLSALLVCSACVSPRITAVKEGKLGMCPDRTLGQVFDKFMSDASWSEASDNSVTVSGIANYNGEKEKFTFEFLLSADHKKFDLKEIRVSGETFSGFTAKGMMIKVCKS